MLKRTFKEIKKIYEKLPYIIVKGKYLIPQKPKAIIGGHLNREKGLAGWYKAYFPEKINADLMNKINDPTETKQLLEEFNEELLKKKAEFRKKN